MLAKQSIFNILMNLDAICIVHIVQSIEAILLDPVHPIIHSITLHRCYKFCMSITFLLLDSSGFLVP